MNDSSPRYHQIGNATITLIRGDITTQDTEAIVNAANSGLLGGGGVDGAIHQAGGPAILEECKAIRARQGGCPAGEAVITTGGRLRAKRVIHTVGPIWRGGREGEDKTLASAYRNSLLLAEKHGLSSIAFPSISTGVYGFPPERASRIAFETIVAFLREHQGLQDVRLVTFSQQDFETYALLFPSEME